MLAGVSLLCTLQLEQLWQANTFIVRLIELTILILCTCSHVHHNYYVIRVLIT